MITLYAPYTNTQYNIELPKPELRDNVSLITRVTWIKAVDGTTYGYKKTPALKKHTLTFKFLTRRKALELMKFLYDSSRFDVKYVDKDGQFWRGAIQNNPTTMTTTSRGRAVSNSEREEDNEITLDFVGRCTRRIVYDTNYVPYRNLSGGLIYMEDN